MCSQGSLPWIAETNGSGRIQSSLVGNPRMMKIIRKIR
jgi:hypothetical protein